MVDPATAQALGKGRRPAVVDAVEGGIVGDVALADLLSRALGRPAADLTRVEPDALREVPMEVAERHALLPLQLGTGGTRRVLHVAMADPLDHAAVREIEHGSGCAVEVEVAPLRALLAAIPACYAQLVTRVIPRAQRGRVSTVPDVPAPAGGDADPARDATVALRLEALLDVLRKKGLVSDAEFAEALSRLAEDER